MALITAEQAAEILGISADEVTTLRERNELRGFYTGGSWKYRDDLVRQLAAERQHAGDEGDELLISEQALGQSGPGASGTILSMDDETPPGSDIKIAPAAASDIGLEMADKGGSAIELDDDDGLVLGGSSGSGISSIGDSGIGLGTTPPPTSGIDLSEEPEIVGSGKDLELGDEDVVVVDSGGADLSAPTLLQAIDDFGLDGGAAVEDDDESASTVIPIDSAGAIDAGGAPILEEDYADAGGGFGPGPAVAAAPVTRIEYVEVPEKPERPWSAVDILLLVPCVLLLSLGGMLMYDVLRNMWSGSEPYGINSSLMNALVSIIEG